LQVREVSLEALGGKVFVEADIDISMRRLKLKYGRH